MKKCPFCAEEIQETAIKCKHCGSSLDSSVVQKKENKPSKGTIWTLKALAKVFGAIILIGLLIQLWYVIIPGAIIWYIWSKMPQLKKQTKYIATSLIVLLSIATATTVAYANRAPSISIASPQENAVIQSSTISIKGTVSPKKTVVTINNQTVLVDNDGQFSLEIQLPEEKNAIEVVAVNGKKGTKQTLVVNRIFSDEEKTALAEKKAQEEAQRQAALETQRKADAERLAKEKAEQAAWDSTKAGQLCKAHAEWTKEECINVSERKYWIGMTYDMLVASYGSKPNSANPSNYGGATQWQYCWTYMTPSCFYDVNADSIIDSYN